MRTPPPLPRRHPSPRSAEAAGAVGRGRRSVARRDVSRAQHEHGRAGAARRGTGDDDGRLRGRLVVERCSNKELRALTRSHLDLTGAPDSVPPVPPNLWVWRSVRAGGDTNRPRRRIEGHRVRLPQAVAARHRRRRDRDGPRSPASRTFDSVGPQNTPEGQEGLVRIPSWGSDQALRGGRYKD